MSITSSAIDELTLTLAQETQVNAPLDATFDAILEEMGPHNETGDSTPMPMILEPRPGGRWFRD